MMFKIPEHLRDELVIYLKDLDSDEAHEYVEELEILDPVLFFKSCTCDD